MTINLISFQNYYCIIRSIAALEVGFSISDMIKTTRVIADLNHVYTLLQYYIIYHWALHLFIH